MDSSINPSSRNQPVRFILGDDEFYPPDHVIPMGNGHSLTGLQNTGAPNSFIINPTHNISRENYSLFSNRCIRIALTCFGLWSIYFYKELVTE